MNRLQTIMEKLESDPSLITQEDYDEIEEISENIVRFLDNNPEINRESFMMGFTVANVTTVIGLIKTTTEELCYENNLIPDWTHKEEKEVKMDVGDSELEEGENPWPFRSRES